MLLGLGVVVGAVAVINPDSTTVDVPAEFVAVAKALYIGAIVVNVSTSAVTEEAPDEDATCSPVLIVGAFPFLETLIVTL